MLKNYLRFLKIRQEEIDIYFTDMLRKFIARYQNQTEEMDVVR